MKAKKIRNKHKRPSRQLEPLVSQQPPPFDDIFVKLSANGIMIPIRELPKEHYEYFLEFTNKIRCAYIAMTRLSG